MFIPSWTRRAQNEAGPGWSCSPELVYRTVTKATSDLEDFALLPSIGMPAYHMASCADDADLRIAIPRGQEYVGKHIQARADFRTLGVDVPNMPHLPLLIAPDDAKLHAFLVEQNVLLIQQRECDIDSLLRLREKLDAMRASDAESAHEADTAHSKR